jgi:hypothetical protein
VIFFTKSSFFRMSTSSIWPPTRFGLPDRDLHRLAYDTPRYLDRKGSGRAFVPMLSPITASRGCDVKLQFFTGSMGHV